jgi:hypothetical protein
MRYSQRKTPLLACVWRVFTVAMALLIPSVECAYAQTTATPQINAICPNALSTTSADNNVVTIYGSNFLASPSNGASSPTFHYVLTSPPGVSPPDYVPVAVTSGNDPTLPTTVPTSTQIAVTLPAKVLKAAGPLAIALGHRGDCSSPCYVPSSNTATLNVLPPPTITSVSPQGAPGLGGNPATSVGPPTSLVVNGANFIPPVVNAAPTPRCDAGSTLLINGACLSVGGPDSISLQCAGSITSSTSAILPFPANYPFPANPIIIAVSNNGVPSQENVPLTILPIPKITMMLSSTTNPPQQQMVQISVEPPAAITGTLGLSFVPSADLQANKDSPDPFPLLGLSSTQFTTDATTGLASVQLQTGTSAGTITVTATGMSDGGVPLPAESFNPPPASTMIPSGPPVISSCAQLRAEGSITLQIKGFSSTREVTKATFKLAAASGHNLGTSTLERDDAGSALFVPYYSNQYAPFLYNQAFVINGSINDVGSVSVTLGNSIGASAAATCQ